MIFGGDLGNGRVAIFGCSIRDWEGIVGAFFRFSGIKAEKEILISLGVARGDVPTRHKGRIAVRFLGVLLAGSVCAVALLAAVPAQAQTPHNVILFVADGLRRDIVNAKTAPTFALVRDRGVNFANSHALVPTLTMPNAAAIASGHYMGDTGPYGNTIYTGFPVPSGGGNVTPMIENDAMIGDLDDHFSGNYLNEETLLAAARKAGYSTAAIGKVGPIAVQDVTERTGEQTIIVDDSTGRNGGIPLGPAFAAALQEAGLQLQAPTRGHNGKAGDAKTPGTKVANIDQQRYFVDVTTKIILPRFKAAGKPFVLVFWSRDPDGTQHYQGDSLGQLVPGINGPTSMASIKNADDNLAAILETLRLLGLDGTTDIFIAADHGFSTISKESKTSPSARASYGDVPSGQLPPGFVAIDLAQALDLLLYDPDAKAALVDPKAGQHPNRANGLIGHDPSAPDVIVAGNGGSDLVYLPQTNAKDLAPKVVEALLAQDYVSGLFVDNSLGFIPGTLPLSTINLKGSALTPVPAIVVNFRSFGTGCAKPALCTAVVADQIFQQGQGTHGSFSRADTANFMAAIGPDFRARYIDRLPASNADVGKTLAYVLRLEIPRKGELVGRVLDESLKNGGKPAKVKSQTQISKPADNGLKTVLKLQVVGKTTYFDAAGFAGRSVGLDTVAKGQ